MVSLNALSGTKKDYFEKGQKIVKPKGKINEKRLKILILKSGIQKLCFHEKLWQKQNA